MKKIILAALLCVVSSVSMAGTQPYQQGLRNYLEGLGVAPNASQYTAINDYWLDKTCTESTLKTYMRTFFGSQSSVTGSTEEQVVKVVRAYTGYSTPPQGVWQLTTSWITALDTGTKSWEEFITYWEDWAYTTLDIDGDVCLDNFKGITVADSDVYMKASAQGGGTGTSSDPLGGGDAWVLISALASAAANSYLYLKEGFYPVYPDISKKVENDRRGMSCTNEESTPRSLNEKLYRSPISQA